MLMPIHIVSLHKLATYMNNEFTLFESCKIKDDIFREINFDLRHFSGNCAGLTQADI